MDIHLNNSIHSENIAIMNSSGTDMLNSSTQNIALGSTNDTVFGGPDYNRTNGYVYSYDTSGHPYPGTLRHVPLWEAVVKLIAYAIIIIMALVGNLLVIIVIWRSPRLHTTTNGYLVNLAVSDLLVTLACTWVHLVDDLSEGWVLGAFFCKVNSFAQVLSLVSSMLTLTLIASDRFFGIVFAMRAHVTERRPALFLALIWIVAIVVSSPLLATRRQMSRQWADHTEIWCDDTWPVRDPNGRSVSPRTVYYTLVCTLLYAWPVLVMSLAYSFIMRKLCVHSAPGEQLEAGLSTKNRVRRKVVLMLVLILLVFAVCWLPFQISVLYAEYRANPFSRLPSWYQPFNFFANYLAFANSAFNPLIYAGFNANFRRGLRALFPGGVKSRHGPITYSCGGQGKISATQAMQGGALARGRSSEPLLCATRASTSLSLCEFTPSVVTSYTRRNPVTVATSIVTNSARQQPKK